MPDSQDLATMKKHTIPINRTARFYTLGPTGPEAEEIWFVLHGYGQLANYFIRNFECLDNGKRLIVAPEALSRFYVGRNPSRVGATWMTQVEREQEIQDYIAYLNQVAFLILDVVESRRKPMTVLGFSQGATTASRWVTMGRLPAQHLIMWAGQIAHDLDLDEYGPVLSALNPFFVIGDNDEYVTPEGLQKEKERLESHDIAYRHIPFEGEHRLDRTILEELCTGLSGGQKTE